MDGIERIMSNKGFTMVELMIAVAILAVIITGMTIALQQQQRQFNLTKEAVDVDQTARATLDYLASEIRNAGAMQGKTFAVRFFNGGSEGDDPCTENTEQAGTVNSPPDCVTLYTWDISRGMEGSEPPFVPGSVVVNQSSPLQIPLPAEWFEGNILIGETEEDAEILIGLKSNIPLCHPDSAVNCLNNPERCTKCSAILRAAVDGNTRTATIDSLDDVIEENLPVTFNSISEFVEGVPLGGLNYGLKHTFVPNSLDMTIVDAKTLRVDPVSKTLLLEPVGGDARPIAGGADAPAIVDFQLVFNLQDSNGRLSKVGVPLSAANGLYPDFTNAALSGREQDIRSVEIYLVVRSKMKPQKIQGGEFTQTIPAIGDVLERTVASPSSVTNEPEEGYTYRILSTTVYMRNHSREEFG